MLNYRILYMSIPVVGIIFRMKIRKEIHLPFGERLFLLCEQIPLFVGEF